MNKKLLLESSLVTILVFIVLWVLFLSIQISFKPFNYVVKSIKSFNLNDLYFSKLGDDTFDPNIIIINIEDLDRKGITDVLLKVNDANPAVIGLDVFLSSNKKTEYDSLLFNTISDLKNKLVMAVKLTEDGKVSDDYYLVKDVPIGHAGFNTNNDNKGVIRDFKPKINYNEESLYSFSSKLVSVFKKSSYEYFKQRDNKNETINYSGDAFLKINHREFLNYSNEKLSLLNNKIVMIGYCGDRMQSMSSFHDSYYTPVGFSTSSNRLPDMYGVLIHANITSMIINNNYINHTPYWIVYLITIILTFLHVLFFTYFYVKKHLYYHITAKLLQLFSFFIILWLVFLIFSKFQIYFPTKYIIVSVILSVDVLYLYEALALLIYKRFNIRSIFMHDHL